MKLVVDELVAIYEKIESGDPYDLLGIGPDASADEVKKRHRKLSSQFNPEILSSQLPEDLAAMAHELSVALVAARDKLTEPRSHKSAAPLPSSEKE